MELKCFKAKEFGLSIIRSLRTVPRNTKVVWQTLIYDHVRKADLIMGYWTDRNKSGVPGHFLEIIKQQFSILKSSQYKVMYGTFPTELKLEALKNALLPPIFFLDTKSNC